MNSMNTQPETPVEESDRAAFSGRQRRAALFSLALIGAVLWPVQENLRKEPRDNFPLSYYPMFSNKREPIEEFWYVVGRDAHGQRHYVPYKWIGDGGGNQVRRQIRRIMNEGRATELAENIAQRVARRDRPPWSEVASISVIRGKYSVDDFFHGRKEPVSEKIGGIAQVKRSTL